MDILVWSGLGNSDYLENDVVFQYIFVLLAEKKKKVYPVFISGVFICILNGLRFYDKHYR